MNKLRLEFIKKMYCDYSIDLDKKLGKYYQDKFHLLAKLNGIQSIFTEKDIPEFLNTVYESVLQVGADTSERDIQLALDFVMLMFNWQKDEPFSFMRSYVFAEDIDVKLKASKYLLNIVAICSIFLLSVAILVRIIVSFIF